MKKVFIGIIAMFSLINCKPDPCVYDFYLNNLTNVKIDLVSLDEEAGMIHYLDTILTLPEKSNTFGVIGTDNSVYDSVPLFYYIDSIKVVFDKQFATKHYKDSSKGNYSNSIFNMNCYEHTSCKHTFTFTQEDFEQAEILN